MDDFTASRTALATSMMRAVHTRLDPNPIIDDSWGERLVPESVRDKIPDEALRGSPAYANVITRSRYTEDALRAAVSIGVRQYVLIGAGFDSLILRRPNFSAGLEIFEIDHPATQGLKIRRIGELGISLPRSVHFIASDLAVESVAAALSRSPFRSDQTSFFSWLGVTMYLTRQANFAILRSIARCAAAGSELVFTYADERMLESQSEAFRALQARVASMGEPFISGFDPKHIVADLRDCGLKVCEDLTGEEIAARYGRINAVSPDHSRFSHIVLARVLQGSPHAES